MVTTSCFYSPILILGLPETMGLPRSLVLVYCEASAWENMKGHKWRAALGEMLTASTVVYEGKGFDSFSHWAGFNNDSKFCQKDSKHS